MQETVKRTPKYKHFTLFIIIIIFLFYYNVNVFKKINKTVSINKPNYDLKEQKLKYILQWTSSTTVPFVYMGKGQNGFIKRNCTYTNCFVTSNKTLLKEYTNFDAILFAGMEIVFYGHDYLPTKRSPHQKYVFASIESPENYPVCTTSLNGYFNWTWTYRLDSDLRWGYIVIRDSQGRVVGPKKQMHWIKDEDMLPVPESLKKVLRGKTKLVAWFVSNCYTKNHREDFALRLQRKLQTSYNLSIDVYGKCGTLFCSTNMKEECFEMIRKDYLFYLSFENANSEDYVTEKLLNAVQNNAIPIVYGGANYSSFLPPGSYLDAGELGVEKLATTMYELMNNSDKYIQYFKWTSYYTYEKMSSEYCEMCALLNNEEKAHHNTVYENFKKWWNGERGAHCYFDEAFLNLKSQWETSVTDKPS